MEKLNVKSLNVSLLSDDELNEVNGGFIQVLLAVGGAVGGLLAISYCAGAAYGIIEKQLK